MPEIYTLNQSLIQRIMKAVEQVENPFNASLNRRKRAPISEGGCDSQNTIWDLTIFGSPTGGTFELRVNVRDTPENIEFNFDETDSTFKTQLATHSQIAATDLEVTAGPLPNNTLRIEFIEDLANTLIQTPTVGFDNLTGGNGRGVIVQLVQRGHQA